MSIAATLFLMFLTAFVTMIVMQRAYTIDRRSMDDEWQGKLDGETLRRETEEKRSEMYRQRWLAGQMRLREFNISR